MTDPRTEAAAHAYHYAQAATQAQAERDQAQAIAWDHDQPGPDRVAATDRAYNAGRAMDEASALATMWTRVAAVQPAGGQCPIAARSEIPDYPEISICCHPAGHSGAHGTSHDDERGLHVWADGWPAAYDFTIIQPEEQP